MGSPAPLTLAARGGQASGSGFCHVGAHFSDSRGHWSLLTFGVPSSVPKVGLWRLSLATPTTRLERGLSTGGRPHGLDSGRVARAANGREESRAGRLAGPARQDPPRQTDPPEELGLVCGQTPCGATFVNPLFHPEMTVVSGALLAGRGPDKGREHGEGARERGPAALSAGRREGGACRDPSGSGGRASPVRGEWPPGAPAGCGTKSQLERGLLHRPAGPAGPWHPAQSLRLSGWAPCTARARGPSVIPSCRLGSPSCRGDLSPQQAAPPCL